MTPRHSRVLALVLSLVPGWGHVYLARERLGLLLFTSAAVSVFVWIDLQLLYQGSHRPLFAGSVAVAGGLLWFANLADVWRRTSPARLKRIGEEKARLLRLGMMSYLRNELEPAEKAFRECLSLDHQEVEVLWRLGVVLARRGQARAARRWFARARAFDFEDKWKWEIARELERLHDRVRPVEQVERGAPIESEMIEAPRPGGAAAPRVPVLEPP